MQMKHSNAQQGLVGLLTSDSYRLLCLLVSLQADDVSFGKISVNDTENILKSKDRSRAGATLAPHGLYLNKVFYTEV